MNTLALSPSFPLHRSLPRKRRGFGLLEVILVFAIVIGAAAVIFYVNQSATTAAEVDHDRTMMNVVESNALAMYGANWNGAGAPVMTEFNTAPAQFAPGFCDVDPNTFIPGCYSSLTGEPINIMEMDITQGGATTGQGIGIRFEDLTTAQCISLLSGADSSLGSAGALSANGGATTVLNTQSDVVNFCTANASGGIESSLSVIFTPTGQVPPGF